MSSHFTAANAQIIRDTVGIGLAEVKRAFELARSEEFNGDVVLAVGYLHANGLAVNIRGDRHAWNMDIGADRAKALRERHPELDAAFPLPAGPRP